MDFYVQQAVLDSGVKILFAVVQGINNRQNSPEWQVLREQTLKELLQRYETLNVHDDPILEGYHILHDNTGVKRRKNIPASENLIRLLRKNHSMTYINQAVDIYNLISLDSKLALGAHNLDNVEGAVTLRFTNGSERYQPLGQPTPIAIAPHEYSYCDSSNEVLCRLEIRQVQKTLVDEHTTNVFYIVEGNQATTDEYLSRVAQQIIDTTVAYCGGVGQIVIPTVIN